MTYSALVPTASAASIGHPRRQPPAHEWSRSRLRGCILSRCGHDRYDHAFRLVVISSVGGYASGRDVCVGIVLGCGHVHSAPQPLVSLSPNLTVPPEEPQLEAPLLWPTPRSSQAGHTSTEQGLRVLRTSTLAHWGCCWKPGTHARK